MPAFGYDNANRLTWAGFGYSPSPGSWASSGPYSMYMNYDNDGDVSILQRNGGSGSLVDNLNYDYRPGTDIDTLITNSAGTGSTYTYDSNGDMTSDTKNNIGFVLYDIYNLPETVYKTDGSVVQYQYGAEGSRIEKEVGSSYNYYIRGKDGKTEVINSQPGDDYVFNVMNPQTGDKISQARFSTDMHYYYLKDHLGDIKMILDEGGTPQVWNDYYPFGETMPGRSVFNAGPDPRYQYVSKEFDTEAGTLHFGQRDYDPWGGFFHSLDPFADKYAWQSPYSYALDNPEVFIDINGDSVNIRDILPPPGEVIPKPMSSEQLLTNAGQLFQGSGTTASVMGAAALGLSLIAPEGAIADALGELATGLFSTATRLEGANIATSFANYELNNQGNPTSIGMEAVQFAVTAGVSRLADARLDALAAPTEFGYRGLGGRFVSRSLAVEVGLARIAIGSEALIRSTTGVTASILNAPTCAPINSSPYPFNTIVPDASNVGY